MRYEIPAEGEPLPYQLEIEAEIYASATKISQESGHLIDTHLEKGATGTKWRAFGEASAEAERSWEETGGVEAVVAASFFGVAAAIDESELMSSPQTRLRSEIEKSAVNLSAWQANVVLMIMALKDNPKGQEVLEDFWHQGETIYQARYPQVSRRNPDESEGAMLFRLQRNGILAVATTCQLLQALGMESQLPTPEQDVRDKVDLFAWHPQQKETIFALQIKAGSGMRAVKPSEAHPKKARDKERLIKASARFSRDWQRKVVPLLVNMETASSGLVDKSSGAPNDLLISKHKSRGLGRVIQEHLTSQK